jgi:predicted acylesterase/phospholipase RssA
MNKLKKPTLGIAMSGSGNRSAFYLGFLEVLEQAGIQPDFITACSGASVVSSAYACGNLGKLKADLFEYGIKKFVSVLTSKKGKGGFFSLDEAERIIKIYTQGKQFSDVQTKLSFITVDIKSGKIVELSNGDLARSARISCTMPGIFEPIKVQGKILVDGGLLCTVPLASLKKFKPDITIGIDMRATPHIFTRTYINIHKALNFFKKTFFLEASKAREWEKIGTFAVLGRSLDLIIDFQKKGKLEDRNCDLMIAPDFSSVVKTNLSNTAMKYYYNQGIINAKQYLPKIQSLIVKKSYGK